MLGGLHAEKSGKEILSVANHAGIGHQDGFVTLDERLESFGELGGAGRAVTSYGNAAERENEFAEDCFIERNTCGGIARGGRRMGVADSVDVGAAAVNQEMHAELGAGV